MNAQLWCVLSSTHFSPLPVFRAAADVGENTTQRRAYKENSEHYTNGGSKHPYSIKIFFYSDILELNCHKLDGGHQDVP